MYGTVARLKVKPGKEEDLKRFSAEESQVIPGMVFQYVYSLDSNPVELFLIVGFNSREAYRSNAESPEQHERYLRYRELLDAEPEWHDGEIIYAYPE